MNRSTRSTVRLRAMLGRARAVVVARRRVTVTAAVLLALSLPAVAYLVLRTDGDEAGGVLGPAVVLAVSPSGDNVPRLAPVRVTYTAPPSEREGSKLVRLEPAVAGQYIWLNQQTLLFQPEYPGYKRGQRYEIHLQAAPEAGVASKRVEEFTATGLLRVVQVIPEDKEQEVVDGTPILVQFSRGVAPLTTLAEAAQSKPVLQFDPPLPGRGEWVNTSLYRYVPASLPPNQRYSVRLQPGLVDASDGQLAAPFEWSFETYGPAVTRVTPAADTRFAAPNQAVTIEFNLPMDRGAVEEAFLLRSGAARVSGTFAWRDNDRVVTFQPSALRPATSYEVELAAGAAARDTGRLARGVSASFMTVGPVELQRTSPAQGAEFALSDRITLTFNNPMDVGSFKEHISITGIPPSEIFVYGYDDELRTIAIGRPVSLKASSTYTLRVSGAKDRYGQPVPPIEVRFSTAALAPSVSLMIPGHVGQYSTAEEQRIYFSAINTGEVVFRLYSLPSTQFTDLMQRSSIPGNYAWDFGSPIREWRESVRADRDQAYATSTSLSPGRSLGKGLYALVATASNTTQRAEFVFSVVDTGIVTKSSHQEVLVWVIDLASGNPVVGAPVRLLGGPGGTRTTDSNGIARFPHSKRVRYDREDQWLVEVNAGGRFGVSRLGWATYPSVAREPYGRDYVGHLYADRVIFRPGEKVEIKGVVRTDDDATYRVPEGQPSFKVSILGPQFDRIVEQPVQLNDFGTFTVSYSVPAGARLGDYRVVLTTRDGGDEITVATTSVAVVEFRKPEFEVSMQAPAQVVAGDPLQVRIQATYLFGGGVAGAPALWQVTSTPELAWSTRDFLGYSFADADVFRQSVIATGAQARGKGLTGADGTLQFAVPSTLDTATSPRRLTVSATVSDQTAQDFPASASVTVFPTDVVPGLRPDRYVTRANEPTRVSVITLRPDGSRYPGRAATVRVYERTWVTTKEQGADGGRYYNSKPVDTLVATETVTTGSNAEISVPITPKSSGAMRVVVETRDDRDRIAIAATSFYVAGTTNASWRYSNDERFEMVADQAAYRVGETAQLLVPAPYPGAIGLVTIERGKNIRQTVMRFESNSAILPIPIGEDAVPNIFVSVVLYRQPSGSDPVPRYSVSTIDLPVSTASRALTVKVVPDRNRAAPRDRVRYQVSVTDSAGRPVSAEVSLALVDKAVLLLAEDRGPTGLLAFWFQRGLGVNTASSLLVLMERLNDAIRGLIGEGTTKGGDGFAEGDPRRDFRNTAFWQASLRTNDRGELTVDVPLPDNVTTWRMQARAVTPDARVGEAVSELLTTTPLIARPALPRFARVGDQIDARVVIRNGATSTVDATVTVRASGANLRDARPVGLRIEPGQSMVASWSATIDPGERAEFTFRANSGGASDSVETSIPVYAALTPESVATGGTVSGEPMLEAVYLPPGTNVTDGALVVSMRQELASTLADELKRFPALRTESTDYIIGRLRTQLALLDVERTPEREMRAAASVAAVLDRQAGDGGFVFCPRCDSREPDLTARALIALGDAKARRFAVNAERFTRGTTYLRRVLDAPKDIEQPLEPQRRAMYLYAIAHGSGGKDIAGLIRNAWDTDRAQLRGSGLAYLFMAMDDVGVQGAPYVSARSALGASATLTANGAHWEDSYPGGRTGNSVLATALAIEALSRGTSASIVRNAEAWLGIARVGQEHEPAWQTGQYAIAVGAVARGGVGDARPQAYSVRLDGKDVLSGRLDPAKQEHSAATRLPLTSLTPGKVNIIEFSRSGGSGQLQYTSLLRYQMPAREAESINRGFTVTREITSVDSPSTRVQTVALGTTVRVKITVIAASEQVDVEVIDPLPAGFEPIDPKLRSTDPALVTKLRAEQRQLNRASSAYAAPWMRWYYSPWDWNQLRDDRVEVYARTLPKGVHEFVYFARATTAGTFLMPPTTARVAAMPDVFGRGDSEMFTVQP